MRSVRLPLVVGLSAEARVDVLSDNVVEDCLADLGGSEQLSKSGAQGQRMLEAIGINTGLLALKQCIRALNKRQRHIPYMLLRRTVFSVDHARTQLEI